MSFDVTSPDYRPAVQGVVQAVGIAIAQANRADSPGLADGLMAAMTAAVKQAQAEGITDPDVIRERILEARDTATVAILTGDAVAMMARIIEDAQSEGVNDPHTISERILTAMQTANIAAKAASEAAA